MLNALLDWRAPRRLSGRAVEHRYDVVIGDGLLARAGALLAPLLPQKRAVVVTDETVARLHLPALLDGLAETAIAAEQIVVPAGRGLEEPGDVLAAWSISCWRRGSSGAPR